jgi:hypothetical protein
MKFRRSIFRTGKFGSRHRLRSRHFEPVETGGKICSHGIIEIGNAADSGVGCQRGPNGVAQAGASHQNQTLDFCGILVGLNTMKNLRI